MQAENRCALTIGAAKIDSDIVRGTGILDEYSIADGCAGVVVELSIDVTTGIRAKTNETLAGRIAGALTCGNYRGISINLKELEIRTVCLLGYYISSKVQVSQFNITCDNNQNWANERGPATHHLQTLRHKIH